VGYEGLPFGNPDRLRRCRIAEDFNLQVVSQL